MTDFLIKTFIRDSEQVHDPAVRERYGVLSGVVGILLNLLLSAGKLCAGVLSASISITADAFNNLSDAGSSVVTLVGFKLAGQKADDGHPFGHGRLEYLTGLLVSLVILLVGLELGKSSIEKILHPEPVSFSVVSVIILAISILVKLWMCLFNRRLGRRIGSAAMAATAADSLSDVAATSAVLAGTLVGRMTGLAIDGWVGALVAVFILRAGWGAAKDTINPLLGQNPDPELVRNIQTTVLSHPQVTGMHDLIIHDYGPGRSMMSFHAEVPIDSDIMEAHDVIDHIERELKDRFGIETSVHMDPIATNDEQVNRVRAQVAALVQVIDPAMTIHDFRMTRGPLHTNLIFDVVVPHKCPLSDGEVAARIEKAVKTLDDHYFVVLQLDRSYVSGH
ncbi:cation diffusion facilitator family transporter [Flavonifractor sp. DFI.6.63]|uniref:Cation transporter n=1 Tax=Lawsonibacter hominis TaxID=2763053 RepID=A0A8J6MAT2_9FIRM|nr:MULTISPECIES: cation diffusion facilitator family transporter [Oscillospiraceae]MBS1385205.1 cation transporter [Flavonifractor sp.]MDU2196582.1 cation diffusion facilitator family transporter [Clostridiales bacterium]MDY2976122.1 cation diffusion facilitator family transporter [Oscillospiraceae bacterium]MBC5734239.1 cation transporter [Lawsonibacter hominis]MCI6398760.1 cation diffusion facilitator family transporter [Lawsonibacter sp.]